jgi:hypothetical protein
MLAGGGERIRTIGTDVRLQSSPLSGAIAQEQQDEAQGRTAPLLSLLDDGMHFECDPLNDLPAALGAPWSALAIADWPGLKRLCETPPA